MSNDSSLEDYSLPIEIIIYIFDFAASSSKASALSISFVCSWARSTVIKHLFTTMVLIEDPLEQPPSTIAPLVRNLWLDSPSVWRPRNPWSLPLFSAMRYLEKIALLDVHMSALAEALERSASVTAYCCGLSAGESVVTDCAPARSTCRAVYILDGCSRSTWYSFAGFEAGRDFIKGITHLHLQGIRLTGEPQLRDLPNLTHLAFPATAISQFSSFPLCSNLRKVIGIVWGPQLSSLDSNMNLSYFSRCVRTEPDKYPMTIIHVAFIGSHFSVDDWKEEVSGGTSIWDRAVLLETLES